jgi:hypothetical protein
MSDRKTISVNPELFNFSSNKTRKKREENNGGEIKMKKPKAKMRDNTLKKKSILNMIRQHQEDKYKKLFNEKNKFHNEVKNEIDTISQIDSDFEQSKNYLLKLAEENEIKQQNMNKTLKQYPAMTNHISTESLLFHPDIKPYEEVNLEFPPETENITSITIKPKLKNNLQQPNYGCLKNGSLPTYRQYMNTTQKNAPIISNNNNFDILNQQRIKSAHVDSYSSLSMTNKYLNASPEGKNEIFSCLNNSQIQNIPEIIINSSENINSIPLEQKMTENKMIENKIRENAQRMSEMKQMMSKLEAIKNNNYKKAMKQKKIIRRSYKIGKSKVLPKIAVLVSNRTIRNNITTKAQLLKQDSINDIKRYLVKRGLIKIGSTAPNDVLRKMYECSSLMCGEVQNHNPDNLLHNFLHGKDEM